MAAVSEVSGSIVYREARLLRDVDKGFTPFQEGDVLLAKITPCMENGNVAVARNLKNGLGCATTELVVLRSRGAIVPEFLHRFLRQESYRRQARAAMTGVVGQARVPREFIEQTEVPLPPLAEQKRIVAKLEELTARSRRAKEALDAVPPLLDQLRQSILAAAFRGDLTADWRAKNPNVEPASDLISRLSEERREQWATAELAKLTSKGKRPTDGAWRSKYVEPPSLDQSNFDPIPASWRWTPLESVRAGDAPMVYGIILPGEDVLGGVPYVRPVDIATDGTVDIAQLKRTTAEIADEYRRSSLEAGDIILSIVGTIGKVAVASPLLAGANITQSSIRIRPGAPTSTEFLKWALQAPCLVRQYDHFRFGNAVQRLNVEHVRQLVLPLPPLDEQAEICAVIQAALARLAHLELGPLFSRLESLDASVLARAFRGELVPQDPDDEPAASALERVRDDQVAIRSSEPNPRRRGRSARSKAEAETEGSDEQPDVREQAASSQTEPELSTVPEDVVHDEIFTALWTLGSLKDDDAARRVAVHMRQARHITTNNGISSPQLLAAIDSAVAANHLDRPLPNHVRAIKPDPTSYTSDDWHHILLTTLPATRTDRETAIRTAAEYARDNLGLRFSRLRSDGHIVQALRWAITTAIRRGDVLRHGSTHISRIPDDRRAESTK